MQSVGALPKLGEVRGTDARKTCEMTEQDSDPITVKGRVKWFDPTKGFGFVVAEEGGPDILLHANVLRNFGQSSVADGAGIDISVQQTERGMQAIEVFSIEPPDGEEIEPDKAMHQDDPSLPLEPARVKWFDKNKGFGFANVFERPEDVFIHVEVLRRCGFADLQPGEAVALRVTDSERGRMATFVSSWEFAQKPQD